MLSRVALLARGALLASLVAFAAIGAFPSFVGGAGPPPLVENDSITAAAPNGDHAHHTDSTLANARLSSQATFASMSQGFAPGSRGARTVGGSAHASTSTTNGIQSVLPFWLGAKNDRPSHLRPALNDRADDTARNLRTTTADSIQTDIQGIKLVDFANILSQLLSQWPALEPNIADMDSLVTVLTSTDGDSAGAGAGDNILLFSQLTGFQKILASPEFTNLQSLVSLLPIIVAKVLRRKADDGNDAMMQSVMVDIVRDAAVGTTTTDSQIGVIADALRTTVIEVSAYSSHIYYIYMYSSAF